MAPNLKNILGKLFSKSVIGALIFAIALWAYTNLNYTYTTYVKMPLEVDPPENLAIDSMPASNVSLQVKGSGWHLFNLIFFNTAARCYINLSEETPRQENTFVLTRNELLKNVQYLTNVEAIDILPETIRIETGRIDSKKVPVRPNINIEPRESFTRVGKFMISPDSVIITGNKRLIDKIDFWPTKYMTIEDVHSRRRIIANLSDSLPEVISVSPQKVNIEFDVQQKATMNFPDVKVKIRGGALPSNHLLQPLQLSITVGGGIDIIEELSFDDIKASVDYREIIEDTTGIIEPDISVPEGVKIKRIQPEIIYHFRETPTLNNITL